MKNTKSKKKKTNRILFPKITETSFAQAIKRAGQPPSGNIKKIK